MNSQILEWKVTGQLSLYIILYNIVKQTKTNNSTDQLAANTSLTSPNSNEFTLTQVD